MMVTAVWMAIAVSTPAGIVVPLDLQTSTIDVEICVQGECDADSSPIGGFMEIALDCLGDPSMISLQDFDMQADQDLNFHLDYGFGGDIFATAVGLALFHAAPGPDNPAVPVVNDEFTFVDVPYLKRGDVNYDAQGIICVLLQGLGLPCSDAVDLSQDSPAIADAWPGTIMIINGTVELSGMIDIEAPLDPENPDFGTISVVAVLNGAALLPSVGDLDVDGDVDLTDYELHLMCANGPGNPPAQTCPPGVAADIDCDGDVDFADFAEMQTAYDGS